VSIEAPLWRRVCGLAGNFMTSTIARELAPPALNFDSPFRSFWMGGFECASHRRHDGHRLDCVASTRHDEFAAQDYRRLQSAGMNTARDGVRWHLVEARPGFYDWSSVLNQVRAARDTRTQVIWDLFHYGWPDEINIFHPRFIDHFARFAHAFARLLRDESDDVPLFAPVNEISFFAWGGGDMSFFNPFTHGRGDELKRQLVRACIASIEAVWEVFPDARIVHPEPMINVLAADDEPRSRETAWLYHNSQFGGWDMICGRHESELGGQMKYLDIIGANYYAYNQWLFPGGPGATLAPSDPRYRPVSDLLGEVSRRYGRPILLAETGIEANARAAWARYIGREARQALKNGVELGGVCFYPIVNHPGWDDDRHCLNGLWDYPNEWGERDIHEPMAREIALQNELLHAPDADEPELDLRELDRATTTQGDGAAESREEAET